MAVFMNTVVSPPVYGESLRKGGSHMARRDTARYTIRDSRGRIQKFGITNRPARRARENARDGVKGKMRIEGPRVTRDYALKWERRKINNFRARMGRQPPRNRL